MTSGDLMTTGRAGNACDIMQKILQIEVQHVKPPWVVLQKVESCKYGQYIVSHIHPGFGQKKFHNLTAIHAIPHNYRREKFDVVQLQTLPAIHTFSQFADLCHCHDVC